MLNAECEKLKGIIEDTLREGQALGADAVEASVSGAVGLSASVRLGEVDLVEFNRDKSLSITVYHGKKKGTVATTDIGKSAIHSALEAALQIARHTEADPFSGLLEKEELATEIKDLDLYHPNDISPEEAIELARSCETIAREYDKNIVNSEGATLSTHAYHHAYGNTQGFLGAYPASRHSLSCVVVAGSDKGMERDYDYSVSREFSDLESAKVVGEAAARRSLRRLNARKVKTMEAPVIFSSEVAGGLFQHFIGAISGGQLYRKASFLLDHLGKQIFPKHISIQEDPYRKRGFGSAPFDQEGGKTVTRNIIEEGVLQGYVLGGYSARKLGLKTTGNAGGVHNLKIPSSKKTLPELLKDMGTGLLVTEVMGHGVNLVTGDYSKGAFGFWVEQGEIQYPVHEITIAGNLKDIFAGIIAIGSDIEKRTNIETGSVWVEKMTIAGV